MAKKRTAIKKVDTKLEKRYPHLAKTGKRIGNHAAQCDICLHDKIELINELYIEWMPVKRIAEIFDIDRVTLTYHYNYTELASIKLKNKDKWALNVIENANVPVDQVELPLAVDLWKHMDKMEKGGERQNINVATSVNLGVGFKSIDMKGKSKEDLEAIKAEYEKID